MSDEEVKELVALRQFLIEKFERVKDYRQNKNAIMREWDHAEILHATVVKIDMLLKEYVNFETN